MSNLKRASLGRRLSRTGLSLCLSFIFSATALAQTQIAAGSAVRTAAEKKNKNRSSAPATSNQPVAAAISDAGTAHTRAEKSASAALRVASIVQGVEVKKDGADIVAAIELDGQTSFNHFTLTKPHRIVVDVRKVSNQATPLLSLGQDKLVRVRTGNFQGNVRVVFDTTSPMKYQISREGYRIFIRFPGQPGQTKNNHEQSAGSSARTISKAPASAAFPTASPTPTVTALTKKEAVVGSKAGNKATVPDAAAMTKSADKPAVALPAAKISGPGTKASAQTNTTVATVTPGSVSEKEKKGASPTPQAETKARAAEKPVVVAADKTSATAKEMKVLPFEATAEKSRQSARPETKSSPKDVSSVTPSVKKPVVTVPAEKSVSVAATNTSAKGNNAAKPVTATAAKVQPESGRTATPVVQAAPVPASSGRTKAQNNSVAAPQAATSSASAERSHPAGTAVAKTEARPRIISSVPQPRISYIPVPMSAPTAGTSLASSRRPLTPPAPESIAVPAPTPVPTPRPADKPKVTFDASQYAKEDFMGEPIKLDLKTVDIREVLRFISDTYKVNFVVDKSVGDNVPVTVSLEEVPWNKALDSLLKSNRLGVLVEGNILRVMAQTAIAEENDQRRKQEEARVQAEPLVTELIRLNYAKAFGGGSGDTGGGGGGVAAGGAGGGGGGMKGGMESVIRSLLSARGKIEPDTRTNTLIVTDIPEHIARVRSMIAKLDVPEPQVEIEARIVIANRNFARDLGVQLGAVVAGNKVGQGGVGAFSTTPNAPGVPTAGNSGSGSGSSSDTPLFGAISDTMRAAGANTVLGLTTGLFGTAQINAILTAQERKGNIKTVSTPRITAQNNQTANVVNGIQIPVQTESNNTVTVTFVTAALKLEITPQINSVGTVMLKVLAENNSVNLAVATTAAPGINTQKAETTVLVPDGGTTIIGGINIETESNSQQRTPGISRIPGLGELFKRRTVSRSNDEILFFITPRIYKAFGTPDVK